MFKHPLRSHALVLLQGIGMTLTMFPQAPIPTNFAALAISLFGGLLGIWTLQHNRIHNFSVYPEIKHSARLITTGPYRWIRHPMYLSLFTSMLGIAAYLHQWHNWLGMMLVSAVIVMKIETEEKYLAGTFPEYARYQKNTYKLLWLIY